MLWKNINGFDYAINEMGQVRNNRTGRILKAGMNKHGYLLVNLCKDGKGKTHCIHRLLGVYFLSCPSDMQVDHIDGNKLNNNLSNLRIVNNQQNAFNRTKAKGYTWNKRLRKWQAQIAVNGKNICLGFYDTEAEARAAYLAEKNKLHIMPVRFYV
jgi:hypothetical protein